jgi:exosortase A
MIAHEAVKQSSQRLDQGARTAVSKRELQIAFVLSTLMFSAFLLLWQTTAAFIEQWTSEQNETYTHGSLITAIAFWLLFRNRYKYAQGPNQLSVFGICAVLAAGVVWLIAVRSGIRTAHEVLLPLVAWLAVYAAMGRAVAIACVFPFAFLLFQTIAWDFVSPVLQQITVTASEFLLSATAVPAYVEGNLIHLPVGTFEVAGGCSGLHFFIVATALGALYGELEDAPIKSRAVLLGLAALIAMVANWVRVYVIVLAGYLTDMKHYLVTVEHYWFGWAVFAATMIPFFLFARRFTASTPETQADAANSLAPDRSVWLAMIGGIAALAVAPLWNVIAPIRAAHDDASAMPLQVAGWSGEKADGSIRPPLFTNADRIDSARFKVQGAFIDVHRVTYLFQLQGRELVNYMNSPLSSPDESILERTTTRAWPATEFIVEDVTGAISLVQVGYVVGELHTQSGLTAQLWYGVRSLIGPTISRAIVLRSQCDVSGCDQARAALHAFASSIAPVFR